MQKFSKWIEGRMGKNDLDALVYAACKQLASSHQEGSEQAKNVMDAWRAWDERGESSPIIRSALRNMVVKGTSFSKEALDDAESAIFKGQK
jgi:hypothetical protein